MVTFRRATKIWDTAPSIKYLLEAEIPVVDGEFNTYTNDRILYSAIPPVPQIHHEAVNEVIVIQNEEWLETLKNNVQEKSWSFSDRIFIVHGHDNEMKWEVTYTLKNLGLHPVILHEEPDGGRAIIEKFEQNAADCGFAIVLFSPDDEGRKIRDENLKPRTRQNVILELGFFFAKLGRGRVMVLLRDKIDGPSDIDGVIYTRYDSAGAWKDRIRIELENQGYNLN